MTFHHRLRRLEEDFTSGVDAKPALTDEERDQRVWALLDLYAHRRDSMSEMDQQRARGMVFLLKRALGRIPVEERQRFQQLFGLIDEAVGIV